MNQQLTHSPTAADINTALKDEIQRWREDQKFALRDTLSTHGKQLSEIPNAFAAATCFQFAVNATEKIFPLSAGAALIKRAAIPIWLISEASSRYKDLYKEAAKDANKLLNQDYKRIYDDFYNKVNDVERGFMTSQFGRSVSRQLLGVLNKNGRLFEDGNAVVDYCRVLIIASQLIPNDIRQIRQRTAAGFGSILEKVYALYQGSTFAGRRTRLLLLRVDEASCKPLPSGMRHRGFRVDNLNPKDVAAEYRDEVKRLAGRFAGKSNCVIPWDLVHEGNIGGRPAKRRTLQILANIDKYDVVHENGLPLIDTPTSIGWNREQPNLSYGQFLHDLTHGLTSSLVAELEQVEKRLWQQRYGDS